MEKAYTTFQIAAICGVQPTTIIQWVKQGRIQAFVTPGGHRRVRKRDLLKFLKEYDFPLPENFENGERRILVVEDEPSIGRLLQRALSEELKGKAEVAWIEDGLQALIHIGKEPPDLVVLDVVMPLVDGSRVLASLRADPRTSKVKVICMTGKKLLGEKLKFIKENADAFYEKPFDLEVIVRKSMDLLKISRKPLLPKRAHLRKKSGKPA